MSGSTRRVPRRQTPVQIGMGFGDVIVPGPTEVQYPPMLDFPAPGLSERRRDCRKARSAHKLGVLNSRLKQSRISSFEGEKLINAVMATFRHRGTRIEAEPIGELASRFQMLENVREWFSHDESFYYDLLAPHCARLDLWVTEYLHVMPDADSVVEWYRGTGLRPFLEALPDDSARERFVAEYRELIRVAYLTRPDGRVVFPFRRLFFVAYSADD